MFSRDEKKKRRRNGDILLLHLAVMAQTTFHTGNKLSIAVLINVFKEKKEDGDKF